MAKGIEGLPEIIYPEYIVCKNHRIADTDKLLSGCAPNNRLGLIYLSEHRGIQCTISNMIKSGKILKGVRYIKECLFICDDVRIPNHIFYTDLLIPDYSLVIEFDEPHNHLVNINYDKARDTYLGSLGLTVIRLDICGLYGEIDSRLNGFVNLFNGIINSIEPKKFNINYLTVNKNRYCYSIKDYIIHRALTKLLIWIKSIPELIRDIRINIIRSLKVYLEYKLLFDIYNIDFRYGSDYTLKISKFELGTYFNLLPDRHGRKAYTVVWKIRKYLGINIIQVSETNWDYVKWRSENYSKYLQLNDYFNGAIYNNINKPLLELSIKRNLFCKLTNVPVGNGINYIPFMVGYLNKYYNVKLNVISRYDKRYRET